MRSDSEPITGSQKRLEAPTHSVTIMLSNSDMCSTFRPKVGVYAVIR